MLDFRGKYKWDAWTAEKGKAKGTAERDYIAFVDGRWELDPCAT